MLPLDVILEAGCAATGLTLDELRGRDRRPPVVARRRFIAMKARAAGYSYPQIGRALGRHHTTIMYLLYAV